MSFATIFVTGANRGIGLELVKQYAALSSTRVVFATWRNRSKSSELQELAARNSKIKLIELDVKECSKYEHVVSQLTETLGGEGLNLLINNAGIHPGRLTDEVSREYMLEAYEVNAVGPLLLTRALIPLLRASSEAGHKTLVANVSSDLSSITENNIPKWFNYRPSKTALNQISKSLSIQLKDYNIIVNPINPGWVLTDMGGPDAKIDVKFSVENILKTLEDATLGRSGLLLNYDGSIIPY